MPSTIDKVLTRAQTKSKHRRPLKDEDLDPISHLYRIVQRQPEKKILAYRISSAHARGAARAYHYVGIATYHLVVSSKGGLTLNAVNAAPTSRRSDRLALQDLKKSLNYAKSQGELVIDMSGKLGYLAIPIGTVNWSVAENILEQLGDQLSSVP